MRDNIANLRALANVQSTTITTFTSVSGAFADLFSHTITPTNSSSQILILARVTIGFSNNTIAGLQIVRNSTVVGNTTGGTFNFASGVFNANTTAGMETIFVSHLDNPATTSAITYKIQGSAVTGTMLLNQRGSDTVVRGSSTLTLMEIPA